ncbi:DUF262 domain-containing HNH endonuclease family protein [Micromonospora sp. NPDC049060]|uniref:DUF262 domain-containing protein n=1 Tax=Micromonospora sp. NPDC049060 TaxID=3154828 RepID=UPI0033D53FE8
MSLTVSATEVLRPRLLSIPNYQRGYAWEQEQVQDFLDDLSLLEPGKTHYTGTIVLLGGGEPLVDDESNALVRADVVDGQQRLTTLCLLLNELRRALQVAGREDAAQGLRRQFLLISEKGVPRNKLQVGPDSVAVWTALLNDTPVPPPETLSAKRLQRAALQIRQHVEELASKSDDHVDALFSLRNLVVTGLHFTLYTLNQQAEVGVIFETLNDRGKPLTELEKVKNYLLFLAARLPIGQQEALADRINAAWSTIYRLLLEVAMVSPAGEDQFLRAHWLAAVDPVPTRWRGTKSLKAHFPRQQYLGKPELLIREIGDYVDSLARAARAYADSLRPKIQAFADFGPLASKARSAHERLSRAGTVAVFQPLMLALRERSPGDGQTYLKVLDLCERFAVRTYLIGGYRADAAQTRLYRLAHEVYIGKRTPSSVETALRALALDYANDTYVRQSLLDTEFNWYRWGALKFFLYEYELNLLGGATPEINYTFFEKSKREKTIEHILPQAANSSYWQKRFDRNERRQLTHALGNLVLTRDNSAYSNKDFPNKRGAAGPGIAATACYAQAPLAQEQELARLADWTPEEVLARQERLADWALKRWAIDFSDFDLGIELEDEEDPSDDPADPKPADLIMNE